MLLFYLACVVVCFVVFVKWRQSYWQRRGVAFIKPEFFFGYTKKIVNKETSIASSILERYQEAKKRSLPYIGMYFFIKPTLLILDPNLIKQIMLKDFNYFMDRGIYHHPNDILTMNLVSMEGSKWRELRTKLTPTFTSGKMKIMFETFAEKSVALEKVVGEYATSHEAMDIKEILGRFTTDIIGSCAFGIECDSLSNPSNDFRKFGKKAFESSPTQFLFRLLPASLLHSVGIKRSRNDVTEFFSSIVKQTIETRETNNIVRNDFMNLLLHLKNQTFSSEETLLNDRDIEKKPLTENEIIAQCFIFFLAGFETSSTTMTFALLELAQNIPIQEKLRKEIVEVLEQHEGKITYDAVMEMPYLDKVINETLRKFPPVPILPRMCKKDYTVSNTGLVIQKGTRIEIPVFPIHRDPQYYPNPEEFDPERFSPEQVAQRPDFTFLPFGEGPRMCIGLRFGLLQSKLGLVCLLKNYRFTLNKRTPLPIVFSKGSAFAILAVEGNVWLNVSKV